jgi:uncharacterized protein
MEIKDKIIAANNGLNKNKVYFKKLGQIKENLDQYIHPLHDQIFEKTDCLKCANCCITTGPLLTGKDIERIAKNLKLKPASFIEQYLKLDEDKDYVFKSLPCPFLALDNICSIYDDRPKACREYPHTNRKNMRQILDLTLKNTIVCPAVYEIFEGLKKELPY